MLDRWMSVFVRKGLESYGFAFTTRHCLGLLC
jgi:hypothetical protein